MELLKLLSANEIVAQTICFLILLAILRVFLWDKFLKGLDARRERIASDFRTIEAAKKAAEASKSDYDARISGIEEEAKRVIASAVDEGKRAAEEVRRQAKEDAEKIFEKSKDNIKVEIAKAEERLKNKIVNITIEAAEKVIEDKLSEESDRKLVEGFINKLSAK